MHRLESVKTKRLIIIHVRPLLGIYFFYVYLQQSWHDEDEEKRRGQKDIVLEVPENEDASDNGSTRVRRNSKIKLTSTSVLGMTKSKKLRMKLSSCYIES